MITRLGSAALFVAAVASAWLIPAAWTRTYGTWWVGLTVVLCLYFWLGSIRYSKPAREKDGSIYQEWLILFTEPIVIGLPLGYLWFFRVVNSAPEVTEALAFQYRVGATIFIIACAFQAWVAIWWTGLQIRSRRELKRVRNG